MQTYLTVSDVTIEPPGMPQVPSSSGTPSRISSDQAPEVIFSAVSPDKTREAVDRFSRMKERLKPTGELLFAPTIDARLRIHTPFRVLILASGDGVSAHAHEIEEFGYGTNRGEALDDLGKTIAELYFSLASDRERLTSDLAGVLRFLEEHITQVHP